MNTEMIAKSIASCDERIASIQDSLSNWKVYNQILNLVDLEMEIKYQEKIQNYENDIKLIQTEKIIYNALLKAGNNALFPKLIARYDELMGLSYDLSGNMVLTGLNAEGDYLEFCNQSLVQREYIRKLCLYGEHR
jgi:hypothetical protein